MLIHRVPEEEQRSCARKAIESLEHRLRRLTHDQLLSRFGNDYISAKDESQNFILSREIRDYATSRLNKEPQRYLRLIDATTLDHVIKIICHPRLYGDLFQQAFADAYPDGPDEARTFLTRINEARNNLSHANHVTVRQVERVLCYSNDIIDSLKAYYVRMNQERDYNAPIILRIADSCGNEAVGEQIIRNSTGRGSCCWQSSPIFQGDTLSLEAQVDPSFEKEDYEIRWIGVLGSTKLLGNRISVELTAEYVRHDYSFYVIVTSNKSWHRCGDCDDAVSISYKILPRK